ncbi:hypothetical protein VC253_18100 [Xanthomonas campestris]|uniref:hypothetical protein n=1 Tax=Xanthomonas campestris TaxID=339 RepID=UPI002B238D14|nr:hypothetical protein [Xanthomonas campestris]MEA9553663.1 hypothetical protein [Xanthomonas campestris]MEB1136584.1 hypothetical protein [Xanthomonas campestris pv. campestris]MEB1865227.1 hypothetical protein [Xanthomonas campestris pv. campestris]MEB2043323.1 hypothetical protein [Xanthomonas campestris pv. campestris]
MSENPLSKCIAGQCPAWPTNDRLTDIESKADAAMTAAEVVEDHDAVAAAVSGEPPATE